MYVLVVCETGWVVGRLTGRRSRELEELAG